MEMILNTDPADMQCVGKEPYHKDIETLPQYIAVHRGGLHVVANVFEKQPGL